MYANVVLLENTQWILNPKKAIKTWNALNHHMQSVLSYIYQETAYIQTQIFSPTILSARHIESINYITVNEI